MGGRGERHEIIPPGFSPEYTPCERNLSREELQLLLPKLPAARAAVVAFIVATGAEWQAVVRAQPSDGTLSRPTVLLRGTKRATRHREVPIVTDDQKELLRYAMNFADGDAEHLFAPWKNVRRDLHAACKEAGIPRAPPMTFGAPSPTGCAPRASL